MLRIISSQLVGFLTAIATVFVSSLVVKALLGIPLGVTDMQFWPRAWFYSTIPAELVAGTVGGAAASLVVARLGSRYALVAAIPGLLSGFSLWQDADYRWVGVAAAACGLVGALAGSWLATSLVTTMNLRRARAASRSG